MDASSGVIGRQLVRICASTHLRCNSSHLKPLANMATASITEPESPGVTATQTKPDAQSRFHIVQQPEDSISPHTDGAEPATKSEVSAAVVPKNSNDGHTLGRQSHFRVHAFIELQRRLIERYERELEANNKVIVEDEQDSDIKVINNAQELIHKHCKCLYSLFAFGFP